MRIEKKEVSGTNKMADLYSHEEKTGAKKLSSVHSSVEGEINDNNNIFMK